MATSKITCTTEYLQENPMVSLLEYLVNSLEDRNYTAYKHSKVLCICKSWSDL